MANRPIRTIRFERDRMGNLKVQHTPTEVTFFERDKGDRAVKVERKPTPAGIALGITADVVSFEYDKAGRLVAEHGANGSVEYELDALDNVTALALPHDQTLQMLRYGSGHVHQIRCGDQVVSDFERDDLHREVMRTQGRLTQRSAYDPLGRTVWQSAGFQPEVLVRGVKLRSETKRFVWEGLRLAQEVRETGVSSYVYSPDASYSPAARVDAVIAEAIAAAAIDTAKHASRIYHFHTDLVGAPLEVTDEAGDLAWAGQYTSWGKVEPGSRQLTAARTDQPLRFAGQYADDSTGLHYNTFRFYDPDVGRFINHDPIGLMGGDNLYAYAPNPTGWIDPWGWFGEKPLNSPDVTKWLDKGGTVHVEVESGTWVYTNAKGTVVRYPNGYPDFKPYEIRSVDVEGLKGNHSRAATGDFGLADAKAGSAADYKNNSWHHHENMVTMQEIPKDIHGEFTHRGGVSNLKNQPSC